MEITKVKQQENGYLVNGTMSVPNTEGNRHYQMVQKWIDEDNTPEPQFTPQEIAQQTKDKLDLEAKTLKLKLLSEITVITSKGNEFDGDDVARADMMSAITSADTLGLTETDWKMANNTWVTVDISEMREALALSIQRKGEILNG